MTNCTKSANSNLSPTKNFLQCFVMCRISIQDFLSNFTKLEICMLSDEKLAEEITGRRWESMQHEGKWQTFVSAGGCRNYPDTFHTNPQYR